MAVADRWLPGLALGAQPVLPASGGACRALPWVALLPIVTAVQRPRLVLPRLAVAVAERCASPRSPAGAGAPILLARLCAPAGRLPVAAARATPPVRPVTATTAATGVAISLARDQDTARSGVVEEDRNAADAACWPTSSASSPGAAAASRTRCRSPVTPWRGSRRRLKAITSSSAPRRPQVSHRPAHAASRARARWPSGPPRAACRAPWPPPVRPGRPRPGAAPPRPGPGAAGR